MAGSCCNTTIHGQDAQLLASSSHFMRSGPDDTLQALFPRNPNDSHVTDVNYSTGILAPRIDVGDRADCYLLAKIIRCQSFSATEVMSLITCLMVRYSSNEYALMSLPNPEAPKPPCGISEMIGM